MRKYALIILILIANLSFAQKDFKTYFKSGKISSEMKFNSSCNCNVLTQYFETGEVLAISKYISDGVVLSQLDGDYFRYFKNGIIEFYEFRKRGAPSGRRYCNYENGALAYENFFSEGYKNGTWKYYNENGTLREEQIFVDKKTKWDSNDDYATSKFYWNNKLAYTVEIVNGRKQDLNIIDKNCYALLTKPEAKIPEGKKLFVQNCSQCHNPNKDAVGPMMKGVSEKRTNDWLIKMIRNGQTLFESKDKTALELYKKWGNIKHPNFERLTDKEMKELLSYLKTIK